MLFLVPIKTEISLKSIETHSFLFNSYSKSLHTWNWVNFFHSSWQILYRSPQSQVMCTLEPVFFKDLCIWLLIF